MKLFKTFRKQLLRAISVWAHRGPFDGLGRHVLAALGKRVLRVATVAEVAEESFSLFPEQEYRSKAPDHFGKPGRIAEGVFPPVGAHVLHNMVISPYSPGIVGDDTLILPRQLVERRDRNLTEGNWMFDFDHEIAIGHDRPAPAMPSAIHVGCGGAFNWFHFMIECLPKAYLAAQLDDRFANYPLLMPDEARSYATYADALEIAAGGRTCHFLKPGEQVKAERILAIDDVIYGPLNLRAGCWPVVSDYALHPGIMLSFISHMRSRLLDDKATAQDPGTRRIYLVRKAGVRRDYNQAELLKIAEGFGFVPVAPETLPLREQARLFAEAEFVVGPSGAAWVGMIFGQPTMRGISWLLREYHEFSGYSLLADLLGMKMEFLHATGEKPISSTREAYSATYTVEPQDFADALERLVA